MRTFLIIMGILVSVLTEQPALADQTAITEQEARVIRVIAYLYFYPLVTMDFDRGAVNLIHSWSICDTPWTSLAPVSRAFRLRSIPPDDRVKEGKR